MFLGFQDHLVANWSLGSGEYPQNEGKEAPSPKKQSDRVGEESTCDGVPHFRNAGFFGTQRVINRSLEGGVVQVGRRIWGYVDQFYDPKLEIGQTECANKCSGKKYRWTDREDKAGRLELP